jgi:hypothetical protein
MLLQSRELHLSINEEAKMLSRESDFIIYFECDAKRCANVLETDCKKVLEAREPFNEAGWVSRNIKGAWFDICPDCQENEVGLAL